MGFISEFKEFASKGNVVDLAVGIIIGAAFGKIISSFVSDILMPPIGMLLGGMDFSNLFFDLSRQGHTTLAAAKAAGAPVIAYGLFINTLIDFIIVAFAVFLMLKWIMRMKKKQMEKEAAKPIEEPKPTKDQEILIEIRDLLKEGKADKKTTRS